MLREIRQEKARKEPHGHLHVTDGEMTQAEHCIVLTLPPGCLLNIVVISGN